ncbi:MAG: hypothetical protein ACLQEQ_07510 [Nitrososphaerales archaeon]
MKKSDIIGIIVIALLMIVAIFLVFFTLKPRKVDREKRKIIQESSEVAS